MSRVFLSLVLISSCSLLHEAEADAGRAPHGFWQCQQGAKRVYLAILASGMLSFDGAPARYRVSGSTLKVQQGGRWVAYPFTLRAGGRGMTITMPNKRPMGCAPVSLRGAAGLRGTLCSWSGSSSSYSGTSISRTTRVHFNGQGTLSYASTGSFTGRSGMHASRNRKRYGMYRVLGKKILLVFPDGSGGLARVHVRQRGGRITEVKYRGKLYASALCK